MVWELPSSDSGEVAAIRRYAHEHTYPVTPRGGGTGLSGGAVPLRGGVCLAFERMKRIIDLDLENLTARGTGSRQSPLFAPEGNHSVRRRFGHAADGNLHAVPICPDDMDEAEWREKLPLLLGSMYHKAVALGGTISGEHGIGHKRISYMDAVMDPLALELMQRVKQAFDPKGIMNPGKVFPPASSASGQVNGV